MLDMAESQTLGYCGTTQPGAWVRDAGVLVRPVWKVTGPDEELPMVSPRHVYHILSTVSPSTTHTIGFDSVHSPLQSVMVDALLVPPILMRPPRSAGSDDDLTSHLRSIVTTNSQVHPMPNLSLGLMGPGNIKSTSTRAKMERVEGVLSKRHAKKKVSLFGAQLDAYFELQRSVASYQDSKFFVKFDLDYGRDRASIKHRFTATKSQRGRLRGNLLGKRGDLTARGVACPCTDMDPDEVGIPISACKRLTFPERVTRYNFHRLVSNVQNGDTYPGATHIERGGHMFTTAANRGLVLGDIVHRHLQQGDLVLVNRQPSLHRFSIMAYRVRPIDSSTIQIHIAVTVPLNADFDGDEINIFGISSYEALAEAKSLMAVGQNVKKDAHMLLGCVQHAVLGAYLLSTGLYHPSPDELAGLLMEWPLAGQPTRCDGPGLLRWLIPGYEKGSVTKSDLRRLLWRVYHQHPAGYCQYLGQLTRLLQTVAFRYGSSMSVYDCAPIIPAADRMAADAVRSEAIRISGSDEHGTVTLLHRYRTILGDASARVLSSRPGGSGLVHITSSGAKGNSMHVVQNSAMVGSQLDALGCRPAKTTSHWYRDQLSAKGLVDSSFHSGLSSTEFFHHMVSARVGLISTAVCTSDTGYVYRKLFKSMEDLRGTGDGSIRTAKGAIIHPHYGWDTTNLAQRPLTLLTSSVDQLRTSLCSPDWTGPGNVQEEKEITRILRLRSGWNTKPVTVVGSPLCLTELIDIVGGGPFEPWAIGTSLDRARMAVERAWTACLAMGAPGDNVSEAYFFTEFSARRLWATGVLGDGEQNLSALMQVMATHCEASLLTSGSPIGVITAQSFSEPLTQMNLDFFHLSGEKGEHVTGVARCKELLNLVKSIKQPAMVITLLPGCTLRAVDLCELKLNDCIDYWFDEAPVDGHMGIKVVLRRLLLTRRGIPPRVVAEAMVDYNVVGWSEVADSEWTVTIHIECADMANRPARAMLAGSDLCSNSSLVAGLPGIRDVTAKTATVLRFCPNQGKHVYTDVDTIITNGSNLAVVMGLPGIDLAHTSTNDPIEVYRVLGIDAAQAMLKHELLAATGGVGNVTAEKHIDLITRFMTAQGEPNPLTFAGMSRMSDAAFKLGTFERSLDSFFTAGMNGHLDTLSGISEAIVIGSKVTVGTGSDFAIQPVRQRNVTHAAVPAHRILCRTTPSPVLNGLRRWHRPVPKPRATPRRVTGVKRKRRA